jgi:UrcA family protein
MNKTFTSLLVAAAASVCAMPGVAAADSQSELQVYTRKVAYSDLDISTPRGAETLKIRLRNAADYVCTGGTGDTVVRTSPRYRKCVHDASHRAVAHSSNPMVAALYGAEAPTKVAEK